MTHQYSVAVRDARNNAIEDTIGVSPQLLIFSGAKPANYAASDPSGLLATLTLPVDWMAASALGVKALAGVWTGLGSGAGNAASYRIKDSLGVTCHIQGTVGVGGGYDLQVDNVSIAVGQVINIATYSITDGNS
jgi:hypothetical protein